MEGNLSKEDGKYLLELLNFALNTAECSGDEAKILSVLNGIKPLVPEKEWNETHELCLKRQKQVEELRKKYEDEDDD